MHGSIFFELRKYVDAALGPAVWEELLREVGLEKMFLPLNSYPDAELMALVSAVATRTSLPVQGILEGFGTFIAPSLLNMHRALIKPGWRTLDVIEHTESTIHRVVRLTNGGAEPPRLVTHRAGANEVVIVYSSPRKMCAVVKGIALGLAGQFNERISVAESSCQLNGAAACIITVRSGT